MTAKEYLERDNNVWRKIDDKNLTKVAMIEFAQNYHESEVKNFGLFSVSQQRELLATFVKYWYKDNQLVDEYKQLKMVDKFLATYNGTTKNVNN
jgi:hypothetical protein